MGGELCIGNKQGEKQQMTISYHGVTLWNSIDTNIEDCKIVSSFKHIYNVSLLSSELL